MSKSLSIASEDALKGQQLTAQYKRAVSGMQEVIIFGAMLMQLRAEHPELTQRGNPKLQIAKRGELEPDSHRLTLKQWLSTYAPEVKDATARRFLAVTESVASEYQLIVGVKVAQKIDMASLVTTPAKDLDGKLAAKQLELFEWVNGTSQRSWLDRFASTRQMPPKPTAASAKKRAANAADETLQQQQLLTLALSDIDVLHDMHLGEAWKALDTGDLADLENKLTAYHAAVSAELKTRKAR